MNIDLNVLFDYILDAEEGRQILNCIKGLDEPEKFTDVEKRNYIEHIVNNSEINSDNRIIKAINSYKNGEVKLFDDIDDFIIQKVLPEYDENGGIYKFYDEIFRTFTDRKEFTKEDIIDNYMDCFSCPSVPNVIYDTKSGPIADYRDMEEIADYL